MNISEQKQAARKEALAVRRALSMEERREKSLAIARHLFDKAEFRRASRVQIYLALRDEVQTDEILKRALDLGKEVAVPVVVPDEKAGGSGALRLIRIDRFPARNFPRGPLGIAQPPFDPERELTPGEIDFWVLPGLAFDPAGRRLGYGLGYYDRILKGTKGFLAALAFEVQIREKVPEGAGDIRVQAIISERGVLDCPRGS